MFRGRPHVFVVDNQVFSSPNSSTIPPIPSHDPNVWASDPLPKDALNICWANPRYPGLAFTPASPRLHSEPFKCLKPPRNIFPIEVSAGSWRLAQATADSFSALERDLCTIEGAMRANTSRASLSLPPSYHLFPVPTMYGYKSLHGSETAAQASAQNSRDAFLRLMGWCSFLMSCFNGRISQGGIDLFRWEVGLRLNGFPLDYIQVIKASELVDFSTDNARVGTFIHHNDHGFDRYVSHWIQHNVPIWIHWGDARAAPSVVSEVLKMYFPSQSEVTIAAAWQVTGTQAVPNVTPESSGSAVATNQYPQPEPRSGQKRGELWHQFFARMDEARAKRIINETPKARQSRLAREAVQAKHSPPGLNSKAPSVYEWEEDAETGFLLRKAITRTHAQDIWSTYSKSQRRYDSTTHMWDLCTALDPEGPVIIEAGNFYDDSDSEDELLFRPLPDVTKPLSLLATHKMPSPPGIPPPHPSKDGVSPLSASVAQRNAITSSSVPPPSSAAQNDVIESSSVLLVLPATQPPIHDHTPPMTTRQSCSPPPTVPPLSSIAQNDITMSSDILPNRLPAIHNLASSIISRQSPHPSKDSISPLLASVAQRDAIADLTSSVTTRQSWSPPPTVPPPSSTAQNDVIMSSDPLLNLSAIHNLTPSIITCSLPGTAPPTPVAQPDVIMSSRVPSPTQSTAPSPILFATSVPSHHPLPEIFTPNEYIPPATTQEWTTPLSPIAPSIPGAHGDLSAHDDDPALSAEPGRYEVLYGGPPATPISLQFTRTLLDDIYLRYGFIGARFRGTITQKPKLKWTMVEKLFGNVGSNVGPHAQIALIYFLETLLSADDSAVSLNQIWDLATDSVLPLADHINRRFRLVVQRSAVLGTIYFIKAKDRMSNDVPWQLTLTDAATVLECFRHEEATSIGILALFLFRHGRPFSTRIRRTKIQTPLLRPIPLLVLGWRPKGHKPTVNEYNFYECYRKAFFDDHPHSRSAHTKGAIIWRLALEAAGHRAEQYVLDGPSEVLDHGACMELEESAESLWDDELSEAEMDLICGVYKYATGELNVSLLHATLSGIRLRRSNGGYILVAKTIYFHTFRSLAWLLVT
jgi:hypothetical protein